jgi:hypothetical protein
MRHLRWALLAAAFLALSVSSPALAADRPDGGGGGGKKAQRRCARAVSDEKASR